MTLRPILIEHAWQLLENGGLAALTPQKLSENVSLPEYKIRQLCPTPLSILLLLWSDVEEKSPDLGSVSLSPHDRLFESIMNTLDTLTPYRSAVKKAIEELALSPSLLMGIKPQALKWSKETLSKAGIVTDDLTGGIKVHIFALFCLYILNVWKNDETPDQTKTLAALDQGLKQLEEWQGKLDITNLFSNF